MRFHTSLLPAEDRPDAWRFALKQNAIDLLEFGGGPSAQAELVSAASAHGIRFTRITANTPQELRLDYRQDVPAIWVLLVLNGAVSCAGSAEQFQAGTLLHGGEGVTFHMRLPGAHDLLLAHLPMTLMRRRLPSALPDRAAPLPAEATPVALLGDMLQSVAVTLARADPVMLAPVEMVLPEFILAAVLENAQANALGGAAGRRASMLDRVCDVIEGRLADPEMSLTEIAGTFGVSQRYIQKLFETRDESFSSYVRQRRLERCREAMLDPRQKERTISDILFGWGFNDSPSFSRAFRARYGISPRDFRKSGTLPRELLAEGR